MNLRAQHFYEPKTSRKYKNKTKKNEPQVPTILIEENDKFYERSTEFLMNLKPQKLDESEAPPKYEAKGPKLLWTQDFTKNESKGTRCFSATPQNFVKTRHQKFYEPKAQPPKFYEPQANQVACSANASGGW